MRKFLSANTSPDCLRDHKAEKSHLLKPYGIVAQPRSMLSILCLRKSFVHRAWPALPTGRNNRP
ncbi:MAG: hypothetical protein C1941_05810 [Prosthecochloris sp.]|nr:hypothetical protein [Prosthecochloris sp.]